MNMKPFLFLLATAQLAFSQAYSEVEIKPVSPNLNFGKTILRKQIEEADFVATSISFGGGFANKDRVTIDVATGNITFTSATVDAAALVFWEGLIKSGNVKQVILSGGNDLSIGASKFGSIDKGIALSTSPQSVVFANKSTWVEITLSTGHVSWREGMVPNASSRLFWDAVELAFPDVKKKLESEK